MINAIQHWTQRHPYTLTGLLFLAMVLLGWTVLGWGGETARFFAADLFHCGPGDPAATITRTIGGDSGNPLAGDSDTVIAHLRDIKELLHRIDSKLQRPASDDDRGPLP